jgi:hypothetical protein
MAKDFYTITSTLGWRLYEEHFKKVENAHAFVMKMLGKDKFKWMSNTRIVAKASGTLSIECDRLEEIMEADDGKVPDESLEKIEEFLRGQWTGRVTPGFKREKEETPVERAKKSGNDGEVISLRDMCERNGWEERRTRQVLRKLDVKKEGRWAWVRREADAIEGRLRKALDE